MKIFNKEYWKESVLACKDLKKLIFAALIAALTIGLDGLKIPLAPGTLEIKITFLLIATGCAIYGPIWGAVIAIAVDILSFILIPTGYPFFPGYMLTEVVVSLIYGLFLFRQKISVTKIFCAKILTNLTHIFLNSLWAAILYDKAYLGYLATGAIKNILLLPIEAIMLCIVFSLLIPPLSRLGLLPIHSRGAIKQLALRRSGLTIAGFTLLLGSFCCLYYFLQNILPILFAILFAAMFISGLAILLITGKAKRIKDEDLKIW